MSSKKQGVVFNPFIVMACMVVACAIASYVITPGAYDRETIDGVTRVLADSYHSVERTPVTLFQVFKSIPEGLTATANMMFVVMLIGGVVQIYSDTGVMAAAINSVLNVRKVSSEVIISLIMIAFFVIGGILGWSEQIIPFVPIVISLTLALGYDSLVGMAISGFACLISFAVGPFNVYTVGTSHTIAELPMFSGWQLRLCVLAVICVLSLIWVLRYARKIKKDPSKSLMADIDTSDLRIPTDTSDVLTTPKILSLIVLAISFIVVIYGLLNKGWSYTEMGAVFLMGGVVVAVINRVSPGSCVNMILTGMRGAMEGALIIGAARAVQVTMNYGNIIDPIVHGLSEMMQSSSQYLTSCVMFIMNFFINMLIPSGSGQATAVMPIMVPLADMLGISRQTAVLAFQFGDGISNTFWFSNGTLLIYCSLAKVSLGKWYKFILPLHGIFFLVEFIFLYIAISIGYGPF
ncbi:MAG: TIGR00366 family protein [Clostridiales bacterium]|nr:TIGR00366 family protein [Clostridiales bacterium]